MYRGIAPAGLSRAPIVAGRHAQIWANACCSCRRQLSITSQLEAAHWEMRGNRANRRKEMQKRKEFENAKREDPQAIGDVPWYRFSPPIPERRPAKVAFRAGPPGVSFEELDSSKTEDSDQFNSNVGSLDDQHSPPPASVPPPPEPVSRDPHPSTNGVRLSQSSPPSGKWTGPPRLHSYIAREEDQNNWPRKAFKYGFSEFDSELDPAGGEPSFGTPITVIRKEPRELPRTTHTSEFLYGYNMCYLALKNMRRKIHRLYIYTGLMRQGGSIERENRLRTKAQASGIPVSTTMDSRLLDAMSKGRPHNGFALEAEPLELPKIAYLGGVANGKFNAPIAQSTSYVQIQSKGGRKYPFVLILDELSDGGNFGAILRSAYFLGVDAVLVVSQNSAEPTAVMSRSSAGALEAIDMFNVADLAQLIGKSRDNGWKFFGAMPSPSNREVASSKTKRSIKWYDSEGLNDPTHFGPVALVMGNEANGLRPTIQKLMDCYATVTKIGSADELLDSLNVAVAASVLCHAFLRPVNKGKMPEQMIDNRSLKRIMRGELDAEQIRAKNTMFKVDDGMYQPPNTAPPEPGLDVARIFGADPSTDNDPVSATANDDDESGSDEEEEFDNDEVGEELNEKVTESVQPEEETRQSKGSYKRGGQRGRRHRRGEGADRQQR
ncbi:hypothetical protein TWF696_002934 [Orbilia brochopaga]|uniref:rRNA methyltransferase 1, mitochondrial n=1 Tax=Orbilia brochopaga TaxID=3140254 RepID=A0AAV9U3Q0_9PEZI